MNTAIFMDFGSLHVDDMKTGPRRTEIPLGVICESISGFGSVIIVDK